VGTFFLVSVGRVGDTFRFRTLTPLGFAALAAETRLLVEDEAFAAVLGLVFSFLAAADFFPPEPEIRLECVVFFLACDFAMLGL
jgi:hypothetical protein